MSSKSLKLVAVAKDEAAYIAEWIYHPSWCRSRDVHPEGHGRVKPLLPVEGPLNTGIEIVSSLAGEATDFA